MGLCSTSLYSYLEVVFTSSLNNALSATGHMTTPNFKRGGSAILARAQKAEN